jgi:pimeloyl-ACP methyl ester carboxylesterase
MAELTRPPVLVCLHGLSGSSRWWSPLRRELERAGPVVLLDAPRAIRPVELTDWLIASLERMGAPVDLAGHSLGALVAARTAAIRPDLVRRLVLIAPPGLGGRRSPLGYAVPLAHTLATSQLALLRRLTADALRAGPANLLRGGVHAAAADVSLELGAIDAPTLLVWGARDRVVPISLAPLWHGQLSRSRLLVLPDAGHVPMYDAPRELAAAVSRFREEVFDEGGHD